MEIIQVAASGNAVDARTFRKVLGFWLVAGVDAATASIFDAATQTGTAKLVAKAAIASMSPPVITPQPGIIFKNGISVTLTGTSPILYLLVD